MEQIELMDNEEVIVEGQALYINKLAGKKVKLSLTNQRLIVQDKHIGLSHPLTYYPLEKIEQVNIYSLLRFLKKGLNIVVGGKSENFELDYPADWKKLIELQIQNLEEEKLNEV